MKKMNHPGCNQGAFELEIVFADFGAKSSGN
jgi:hypothetical protein